MAKLYPTNSSELQDLHPRKETIRFLLDYSKSLHIVTCKKMKFELRLN